MNRFPMEEGSGIPALVDKLVNCFTKTGQDKSGTSYKMALNFLMCPATNEHSGAASNDEQHIVAEIRKHLLSTQSRESVDSFDMYYTRLQKRSILKHREKILDLLFNLSRGPTKKYSGCNLNVLQKLPDNNSRTHGIKLNSASLNSNFLADDGRDVRKLYESSLGKNYASNSKTNISQTTVPSCSTSDHDLQLYKDRSSASGSSRSTIANSNSVPEDQIIQEVIYSFQGIEGRMLRKDPTGLAFNIDPKQGRGLTTGQRALIERLSAIGFLHNQLKQHCDEADKQIGLIGQSLIAIFRDELTNYYKLIALLQAQLKKQGFVDHSDLTLRRLVVWVAEPQGQLQWLAYIAEQCNDKKGGALVSIVHRFLQHGSICAQKVSAKVLSAVCTPLYLMLSKWLLDGKLNDPCGEFFIEARCINAPERLWHDKYHVRKAMIPTFITIDQANKILATGKSINFLRQICKDNEDLPGRGALINLFATVKAEALFAPEQTIELHNALESVYRETSLRVLDLLKNKYRLLEHLQALRKYLLLGQGDFIRHLLELLNPELCKPAEQLYGHTLTGILESAVRVTNAQFEEDDTLQRLNVSLMGSSSGDIGWDVFRLVYLADGPVETVFKPMESVYKSLFGALWRAKRMEFVLANMRRQQLSSSKLFRQLTDLKPVSHAIHVLSCEMIHFLHQTQYYFLFEVLECSWAEMLIQVNQANCLDDVILAHSTFLTSVRSGVLLDSESKDLCFQLNSIFTLVLNLESIQESFYTEANSETEQIKKFRAKCNSTTGFGLNTKLEMENSDRLRKFQHFTSYIKTQVKTLSNTYKDIVKRYLKLLAASPNMNLQLLSVRLNFNDYYKLE